MDVSCHSLMRLTKVAEPLMKEGGTILTMSYYGAEKVVTNYNLMGPVKAALETSVKYLSAELGAQRTHTNGKTIVEADGSTFAFEINGYVSLTESDFDFG